MIHIYIYNQYITIVIITFTTISITYHLFFLNILSDISYIKEFFKDFKYIT